MRLDELLQIEAVGRHAEDEARLRRRRFAHRVGVADGAVEPDLIDAEPPSSRHADRQVVAGLHDEPE
jgi:hypothetical protein